MRSANIGENTWCSPTVLSILTGKTTDECARVYSHITGRSNITEVYFFELKKALDYMRYEYKEVPSDCSLYSLFIQLASKPGFYIVEVRGHVVAVEVTQENKVFLCDNHTKEPINGAASARMGQRCIACLKVTPKPDPVFLRTEIEVSIFGNTVDVMAHDIYERIEDCTLRKIAVMHVKDKMELRSIVEKLNEKVNGQ